MSTTPENENRSAAFRTFGYNLRTFHDLIAFFDSRLTTYNDSELPAIRKRYESFGAIFHEAGSRPNSTLEDVLPSARETAAALAEYLTTSELVAVQHRFYVVMLVTMTEAYLQDRLAEAAAIDTSLVAQSDQKLKYDDLQHHDSIESIAESMRRKWARHFIDRGGPALWIERFSRMGVRSFPDTLASDMEEMWGVRHLVVHRAGVVDAEFERRHPHVPVARSCRVEINSERIARYGVAVVKFVGETDRYLDQRCAAVLRLRSPQSGT